MFKSLRFSLGVTLLLPLAALAADPVAQLAAARAAGEARDYALAEKLCDAVIQDHPHSSEAYIARAFNWLAQGKRELAAADFKQAVTADPTNPKAYLMRGDLAYRMIEGDFAACEADYATVLKLDPEFPGFRAYSAELYLYKKDPARVITEAMLGLLAEPGSAIHKLNLAHGLAFGGQLEAAKATYRAIAHVEIAHGRTGVAFALGDFAQFQRKGLNYPEIAELIPFLESLSPATGP